MEVTLQALLDAREQRAARQQALLAQYHKPLLCFTMNIAGPEKYNDLIHAGFSLGCQWLQDALAEFPVLYQLTQTPPTGCEGYFVVDAPAEKLKLQMLYLEEYAPVARLFDLDVLDPAGKKLEREDFGFPARKCLICEESARICGRSRRHSVAQLQEKTQALLQEAVQQQDAAHIAQMAQKSLLFEVCTTPKPGLVDCRNNGSHQDMDIFTFMSSATALQPYFAQCAQIGITTRQLPPTEVFAKLRFAGKLAEQAMYRATGGINTHKGAIFSLGILCAAAGRQLPGQRTPEEVLSVCKAMTKNLTANDLRDVTEHSARTAGEQFYAKHGITGVRGQAEQGFPSVLYTALPVLEKGLQAGLPLNDAGCAALLHLLSATVDTNLIRRGSLEKQQEISAQLQTLLTQTPYPDRQTLEQLDDAFIAENLSPGGSADLLALTYFLHFLNT